MKKKDLERKLKSLGCYLKRHGAKHDFWTNGEIDEMVPRHNEVDEILARKIIRSFEHYRG